MPSPASRGHTYRVRECVLYVHNSHGGSDNPFLTESSRWGDPRLLRTRNALRSVAVAAFLLAVLAILAFWLLSPEAPPDGGPDPPAYQEGVPTSCSDCHANLPESLSRPVREFNESVHFTEFVTCVDCHGGDPTATNLIDSMSPAKGYLGVPDKVTLNAQCSKCHSVQGAQYRSGVHDRALREGNASSSSCADCHGAHRILPVEDVNATIHPLGEPSTCGACHPDAAAKYGGGVHWRRVQDDLQGATCSDCHRSHDILPKEDPTSSVNFANEAGTCANCHSAIASISGWYYGVKTDRLQTYQESYHSRALKYGDERVATCSDCHENHNVRTATDPESSVYPDNLPSTCGRCHATSFSEKIGQGLVHDREAAHSGELRWDTDDLTPAARSYYLGPFDLGFWVPLFFQFLIPSVVLLLFLVVVLGNVRTYLEDRRK